MRKGVRNDILATILFLILAVAAYAFLYPFINKFLFVMVEGIRITFVGLANYVLDTLGAGFINLT